MNTHVDPPGASHHEMPTRRSRDSFGAADGAAAAAPPSRDAARSWSSCTLSPRHNLRCVYAGIEGGSPLRTQLSSRSGEATIVAWWKTSVERSAPAASRCAAALRASSRSTIALYDATVALPNAFATYLRGARLVVRPDLSLYTVAAISTRTSCSGSVLWRCERERGRERTSARAKERRKRTKKKKKKEKKRTKKTERTEGEPTRREERSESVGSSARVGAAPRAPSQPGAVRRQARRPPQRASTRARREQRTALRSSPAAASRASGEDRSWTGAPLQAPPPAAQPGRRAQSTG